MVTKNDCILILSDLKDKGINIEDNLNTVLSSNEVPLNVIKFINSHRQLDLSKFYENLRKNYNHKKSKLYGSIVKENLDPSTLLTTLSSLLLQIVLFSNKVEDKQMFLRHSRAEEISKVLTKYFIDYDLTLAMKLLRLIKSDLKILESVSK